MATPISEQIAVVVATRLGLITTTNSYEVTTTGVIRPTREGGFQPKDYQLILTQGSKPINEEMSRPGNPPVTAYDMEFRISGIVRPSENDTTAIDTLKNTFEADVQKALATPVVGDWRQMENLAVNSNFNGVEVIESDDGSEGSFVFSLIVTYRTPDNDPYTVSA